MTDQPTASGGKARWLIVGGGLLLFLVLLLLMFLPVRGGHFIVQTIDYVAGNLASRSGLSPFLVKGLVILLTIPFFWAVAKYTKGLFWFRGVRPSLRLYSSPYGIIIVVYLGLFFLAMYGASRKAYAYKWCVETPEGIKAYDAPGRDPVYGLPLSPCSFDQIVAFRGTETQILRPQKLHIDNPRDYAFFDSITHEPRVYYSRSPDGGHEIYDRKGVSPETGKELQPINTEIINELIRSQDEQAARTTERQKQQAAADSLKRHAELLERYLNTTVTRRPGVKQAAVAVLQQGKNSLSGVEAELGGSLKEHGVEPLLSFFKPAFFQDGRAHALYEGDWNQVQDLALGSRIDCAIVGTGEVDYIPSAQFQGLLTAKLRVELKILDLVGQREVGGRTFQIAGAGTSEAEALQNAIERLRTEFGSYLATVSL